MGGDLPPCSAVRVLLPQLIWIAVCEALPAPIQL